MIDMINEYEATVEEHRIAEQQFNDAIHENIDVCALRLTYLEEKLKVLRNQIKKAATDESEQPSFLTKLQGYFTTRKGACQVET